MFCVFVSLSFSAQSYFYSCKLGDNGTEPNISKGYDGDSDAWISFNDTYDEIGWGKVYIWTNGDSQSYSQMYCAGYLDYYVTYERVSQALFLFNESTGGCDPNWPDSWLKYFQANMDWTKAQAAANDNDPFWHGIGLVLAQFEGMVDGYNSRANSTEKQSALNFWIFQSGGDLDDIAGWLPSSVRKIDPEFTLKCTGMIVLAPDYSDLYFAQDTWSDVRDLHAYLKEYNLNVNEFKAHRVSISTRTGHLASVDDFWTNDQGLLVLETTMHCFNTSLYDEFCTNASLLCWIRAYHAMWVTDNGKDWTSTFIRENSGTYNNEYLVVDTKKFQKNVRPTSDLLWMIEQLPGHYNQTDVTPELVSKGYFESINTPRENTSIWFLADYPGQQKREPLRADFWSFHGQIRELIILRDAPKINNYQQFQKFMRYNNYTMDPIFIINGTDQREPAQGILARYDLRPENGTNWGVKNHFAGLDSKTLQFSVWTQNHTWDAELSPVWGDDVNIPFFSFDLWPNVSHTGITNNWTYPWIQFPPGDLCPLIGGKDKEKNCTKIKNCGFCIPTGQCMHGDKKGPDSYFGYTCKLGWKFNTPLPKWGIPVIATISSLAVVFVIVVFAIHFYSQGRPEAKLTGFGKL